MNRKMLCVSIVCLLLLLLLCGCHSVDESVTTTNPPTSSLYNAFDPVKIEDMGPYWRTFLDDKGYRYIVYGIDGQEIIYDMQPGGWVEFELISDRLLCAHQSGGNESHLTRYYDLGRGRYSPKYNNATVGYGFVAYLASDYTTLVVHDIFNPGVNLNVFKPNFWISKRYDLPPEIIDQFNVQYPFKAIEFLDETHLRIEYLDTNKQFVKETLVLSPPIKD